MQSYLYPPIIERLHLTTTNPLYSHHCRLYKMYEYDACSLTPILFFNKSTTHHSPILIDKKGKKENLSRRIRDNNLEGSLKFQLLKLSKGDLLGSLPNIYGINLSSSCPNIISGADNGLSISYIISPDIFSIR